MDAGELDSVLYKNRNDRICVFMYKYICIFTHNICFIHTHIYINKQGLLEWLIDCGPPSLTMAVLQWKGQESNSCSVHRTGCLRLIFSIHWNPK